MSKFYGTVIGDRQTTNATRRGWQSIRTAAQSWDGSIVTELTYRGNDLMVEIRYADTSTTVGDRQFYGTVNEFLSRLKGDRYESVKPTPNP